MNATTLINRISRSFQTLFADDAELFDLGSEGVNEQTLTFRLRLYLAEEFRRHNVDCEYNRLWDGTKKCVRLGITWMKPDVIVHLRQSDAANLFCLEAKKQANWKDLKTFPDDVEKKLRALTHMGEAYHYSLGLAWRIAPSANLNHHEAIWFLHGEPRLTTNLGRFEKELFDELIKYPSPALQQ